ncbi:MAG: hypothetical protein WCI72_02405 [archaeon]
MTIIEARSFASEGLIFNIFEHAFEENCPLAAVNASHFLPYKLSVNKTKARRVL